MNQTEKDVLQAVKEGCRTTLQVAVATDLDRQYCARILKRLVLEGHIEIYEKIKYGTADGGNRYRAVDSRYMAKKKLEEFPRPTRDPLVAALFGGPSGDERYPETD